MLPSLLLLLGQEAGEDLAARMVEVLSRDHPGTRHGAVTLRATGEGGAPVEGASVSLHARAPGWGGAAFLVAASATDAEGRARFEDANSEFPLECRIVPDRSLRRRVLPLPAVSAGTCDLGEVRLEPNLVLAGIVEIVEPDGTVHPAEEGVVRLVRTDGRRNAIAFFPLSDGTFVLDEFDAVPARLEVEVAIAGKRRTYSRDFAIDPGRRARRLALSAPIADPSEKPDLRLTVLEEGPSSRPVRRWRGRVLLPDGTPAAGLPVVAFGRFISERAFGPRETSWTDAEGQFEVTTDDPRLDRLRIETPGGEVWIVSRPPAKDDWLQSREFFVKSPEDVDVPLEELSRREFRIEGVPREEVALSWLPGGEWRPCPEKLATLVVTTGQAYRAIRASAPGHLSRSLPGMTREKILSFSFRGDVPHELVVRGAEGVLAGARIDVVQEFCSSREAVRPGSYRPVRRLLDRLRTDEKGRVEVLADPGAIYRVHVYAEDHEPADLRLRPGRNDVVLAPRDARVRLRGFPADSTLRLKRAGREDLVAFLRPSGDDSRPEIRLAPGRYDVSVQAKDGSMVGGTTFEVVARQTRDVDLSKDERPKVVVGLPPLPPVPERLRRRAPDTPAEPSVDHWEAWATRRTPPGGPADALAMSSTGTLSEAEPWASAEAPSDDVRILRLSGTGRFQIHLGARSGSLQHGLFREIEVAAGETLELEVPPLDATLAGTMAGFSGGHHGVAGPRLVLLPAPGEEGPRAWGVICDLPPRVEPRSGRRFELPHLPPGRVILFDHLGRRDRWGGPSVDLRAGETADVGELADSAVRDLQVTVLDAEGRPARDAALRVRDRMSEAWQAFTEIPTTGIYASDPIPLPPAARLEGAGAVLRSVRPEWLELEVESDSGRAFAWFGRAEAEGGLTLRVPR